MIRNIYCPKCGAPWKPHPGDISGGWSHRHIGFAVKKPDNFSLTVNGERFELQDIKCDRCGDVIPEGSSVHAITMWRKDREEEPGPWEQEYQK